MDSWEPQLESRCTMEIWEQLPINKSKNHLVLINDINFEVRNTYNKALFSLHDTKLDEKLDLERMVGLRNSEQSEILNGC